MRVAWFAAMCAIASVSASAQQDNDVRVDQVRAVDTGNQLHLENRFVKLTFDPKRGGRCIQFLLKDSGEQIVGSDDVAGLFIDHWAKYAWPSGLMHLPYKHEFVRNEDQVGIRLWVQVPKFGGGQGLRNRDASMKMATSRELVGLTVRKTIWLRRDRDVIRVEQEVVNTTNDSRAAGIYIQQNLRMNGSRFSDNWYLPSTRGIEVHLQPDQEGGRSIGPDWINDPVSGWMAVKDSKTNRGLLFAFDYNYLRKTYTSGATGEWFLEPVPIAPGKSFRTEYFVNPVGGFRDFVHGSPQLVADIQADEIGDGQIQVTHDLSAVNNDLSDVRVEIAVTTWKSKKRLAAKSFVIDHLTAKRQRQQFRFPTSQLGTGVVIKAVVRNGTIDERYEYFYAGDKAELERRTNHFATKGGALAGARGDAYYRPQPRKRNHFDKPDFTRVARPDPDRFRCLVVFGLYTHILNIDDAVAGWKIRGKTNVEFDWANCPPNAVEKFPGTYDELFQYNLIVLSDVNYKALGDIAMEMICDYVQEGGNLLVVGGPYAYGNGEFQGSRFLEVLPVQLRGPFDLKWAGKGKSWKLKPSKKKHALLDGISFQQNPRVFWHHFVTPKPGATVVLKAGDQPTLILGHYGKGRVAALTLSPTGVGSKTDVAWWDWDGWFALVRNMFTWLNQDKQK